MLRRNTYKEITSGGGTSATQTEIYEIFEGTNPQGIAVSLFENLSGNDTSLANLTYDNYNKLSSINTNTGNSNTSLSSIDTKLSSQATASNQTTANTSLSSIDTKLSSQATASNQTTANTSLSSIDTKLSSQATASNQTTANTSLNNIDVNTSNTATNVAAINTNTANTLTAVNTSNSYLSVLRTPVIISTSGSSAGINAQIHNISFANVGSAVGTITVNGTTVNIPVGAVIDYNAGGLNNRFPVNVFGYNGTGTTLLITYVN